MKIIVCSSFFPTKEHKDVPKFVSEQMDAFLKIQPDLKIIMLTPMFGKKNTPLQNQYPILFFPYFWPRSTQKLAGSGMLPTLNKRPVLWVQVPFLFFFQFLYLLKTVIKEKPNYIYAHWFTPQGFNAGIVSILTRTPFVFTSHSSDVMIWHRVPFFGKYIVRFFVGRASAVSVVSNRSLQKIRNFFDDSSWAEVQDKIHVIPMGVNFQTKNHEVVKIDQQPKNKYVILFIGRLVEKKGVSFLLKAFSEIREKLGPDASLVIAGDGELKYELETLSTDLGIGEQVSFVGFISGGEKSSLVNRADLFVVPSIITKSGDAEGLPVSLLEGLSTKKICIATNESGADDILNDKIDGFLIPGGDVDALAKAILNAHKLDPKESRAIREAAYKLVCSFSWDKIAKLHLDKLFKKE